MRNKIKKIITSLALAASLALAPMNVSADPVQIDQDDNSKSLSEKTGMPVFLSATRMNPKYTVEVPESIEVKLDDPEAERVFDITLKSKSDMDGRALKVNPKFRRGDADSKITIVNGLSDGDFASKEVKLGDLGIPDGEEFLTFGNGDEGVVFSHTDVAGTKERVTFDWNEEVALEIKQKINVNDMSDEDWKVSEGGEPQFDKVRIGDVVFDFSVTLDNS